MALAAADCARSLGQTAPEAVALHEAVRLGAAGETIERLGHVATLVDGDLVVAPDHRFAAEFAKILDEIVSK